MRWDAARAASRRQLPKPRKMMGPVGEQPNIDWGGGTVDLAHICCGMIICSCKPVDPIAVGVSRLTAELLAHPDYALKPMRYMKLDQAYPVEHNRAIFANPATLKAFMDKLDSCGVKVVTAPDPLGMWR